MLPLRGKIINVEKSRIDKVLSNVEIQALITAIGTGVADEEFDVEDLRYHKVVLMTDADVDGAHIRTLVLTFLYRQMPELIEQGFVYIAKPPLYKVKQGSKEIYVERESELEELLLRDKLDQFEVMDAAGKKRKLSAQRWKDFNRHYKAFEGWASTLRAEFGHEAIDFVAESHLLPSGAKTMAAASKLFKAKDPKDRAYETKLLASGNGKLRRQGHPPPQRPRPRPRAAQGAVRVDRLQGAGRRPREAGDHGRRAAVHGHPRRQGREGRPRGRRGQLRRAAPRGARAGPPGHPALRASRASAR